MQLLQYTSQLGVDAAGSGGRIPSRVPSRLSHSGTPAPGLIRQDSSLAGAANRSPSSLGVPGGGGGLGRRHSVNFTPDVMSTPAKSIGSSPRSTPLPSAGIYFAPSAAATIGSGGSGSGGATPLHRPRRTLRFRQAPRRITR